MMELGVFEEIVLGALLHDIGKIIQRASENPRSKRHQEFGHEWLLKEFPETLAKVADYAKYHHLLGKNDPKYADLSIDGEKANCNTLWIVYEADNLSAGERLKEDPEEYQEEASRLEWDSQIPLLSIFWKLRLNEESRKQYNYLNKPWFFKPGEISDNPNYPEMNLRVTREDYARLLEGFHSELKTLLRSAHSPKQLINIVLNLSEKYFAFVPAETSYVPGDPQRYPDVSYFDHAKTTAAIASAMCKYLESKKPLNKFSVDEIRDRNEPRYLLLHGDISGIQDFIYTVTYRAALKGLRGRSFYITLLTHHVVNRILDLTGMTRASVIYEGGGSFYLLLPNTEDVKNAVDRVEAEINRWLLKEHYGKLFIALSYVELNGFSFIPNSQRTEYPKIHKAWGIVHQRSSVKKSQKFQGILTLSHFEPQPIKGAPCDVCGSVGDVIEFLDEETGETYFVCRTCEVLKKIGALLPRASYVIVKKKHESGGVKIENWSYLLVDSPESLDDVCEVISLNAIEHYFTPMFIGKYPGEGREFEKLVENSIGAPLLGTLRADVDNMGKLLQSGLRDEERTLSRLTSISRLLSLFFGRYINSIAEGELGELQQFRLDESKNGESREVVVVYSGGDDLFLTGAWSDLVETAFDIKRAFSRYTCYNPDIGLSAGFVITAHDYPLYRIAKLAGEAEGKAKDNKDKFERKDSLALFMTSSVSQGTDDEAECSGVLKWTEWEELVEKLVSPFIKLGSFTNGRFVSELPRSLIYRLMTLARISLKRKELVLPIVAYVLARAYQPQFANQESTQMAWNMFVSPFVNKDQNQALRWLRKSLQAFMWLDLLQRRK